MDLKVSLNEREVAELIKKDLESKGLQVIGDIRFNHNPGYNDPREYQAPYITVEANVRTK